MQVIPKSPTEIANVGTTSEGSEDYLHILSSKDTQGPLWNDYAIDNNTVAGYVVEYGGMPGDLPTVKSGVRTMTVYATEALANVEMMLNDFVQAGVTGVTAANLAAVNEVMRHKALSDTDTNPKLQSVVDGVVAAIGKIENYNNAANGVSTLSEADYAAAGNCGSGYQQSVGDQCQDLGLVDRWC